MDLDDTPVPDYAALHRVDGRAFVLLGAGNGIGRQTAHALTSAGARVLCVDVDKERAEAVAAQTGGIPYVTDVTRRQDMRALFAYAQRELGSVGGVVDIVGMARYEALDALDDDAWQWHFDLVLRHAWLAVQYGERRWRRRAVGRWCSWRPCRGSRRLRCTARTEPRRRG